MIQGSQWPSFIIQAILLGSDIYLVAHANLTNHWVFLSILSILTLFCLQATSTRFIYLFPVNRGTNISTAHWDTHILRFGIIFASLFLYLGIRDKYPSLGQWWFLAIGIFFLVVIPFFFNFYGNKQIGKRVSLKHKDETIFDLHDNQGNLRGKLKFSADKLIWESNNKQYQISWDELLSIIEKQ